MVSLEAGHVYVVFTTLTKPDPKDKIVVCVCPETPLFVWFNSKPQRHGHGQLRCAASDHGALSRDCFLDLSRVTTFSASELTTAKPRGPLSGQMRERICRCVVAGIATLPPRFAELIVTNLETR